MSQSARKSDGAQAFMGKKFHMLTVESFAHYSPSRHPYWHCKCDCGNTSIVCQYNLTSGNTKSCGCLKVKRSKTLHREVLTNYGGTQIEMAAAKTTHKNNTSGFRGVSWVEKTGKWRAGLAFRGTRYHLGYYTSFDQAVEARLKGEEMVDEFIMDYYDHVAPKEAADLAKLAFENQIHAKAKSEGEFKRIICGGKDFAHVSIKTAIVGNVKTDEHLVVSGTVMGDVHCTQALMVNGTVKGNVSAQSVYIPNGKIVGDITAERVFCSNVHGQVLGKIVGTVLPYTRLEQGED